MRTVTLPAKPGSLCPFTVRHDAACRHLKRCSRCNRALSFNERYTCDRCLADVANAGKEARHE